MRYRSDPERLVARFAGICAACGKTVKRHDNAYYWPNGKKLYCEKCGEPRYQEFLSMAADEDGGNPYAN